MQNSIKARDEILLYCGYQSIHAFRKGFADAGPPCPVMIVLESRDFRLGEVRDLQPISAVVQIQSRVVSLFAMLFLYAGRFLIIERTEARLTWTDTTWTKVMLKSKVVVDTKWHVPHTWWSKRYGCHCTTAIDQNPTFQSHALLLSRSKQTGLWDFRQRSRHTIL